jgi:cytochrome c peroxidase
MRLVNARFNESGQYFWDRRAPSLSAQVIEPIQDAVEMGFDASHGGLAAAIAKVSAVPFYARLFTMAFGDAPVTQDRVQRALAQYVRSIVSVRSRWDVAVAASGGGAPFLQPMPGFTAAESRGQQLFFLPPQQNGLGCAGCHVAPSFSLEANSRSNGLDAGETRIFRSPSLKTVGMGNRYMHDGRFATLEEVVEFYDSGVQDGPALDSRLATPNGTPRRLNLSAADKAALAAFMRTLRDSSLTTDPRFGDPFRR